MGEFTGRPERITIHGVEHRQQPGDRCAACWGRGALWLGGGDYLDCPECEGKGIVPRRRTWHIPPGIALAKLTTR